jgi:phosphatidate cytidylyltransferase
MPELLKRFLTSIILLPVFLYCVYLGGKYLLILQLFFYLICFYEIHKNSDSVKFKIISNIILFFAFYSLFSLRGNSNYSLTILLWVLISTFLSDIGGYVFGKIFKGKKLTKISPNKTYSGSFGSLIFSLISLPLINFMQIYFLNELLVDLIDLKFTILTLLISIICQVGDLLISLFKRKLNIKDTGNFLPGHGGVLDRIDGLIFVLIFINIIKKYVYII